MDDLTQPAGIAALAAGAVALIALVLAVVLAVRMRRLRADQRVVLGASGREDLVAHASSLQQAFEALHGRVEEVAERLDARMGEAEARLDGAIAYRALVRYDAYGELSGPPVDLARAARRRPQRRRALLDRQPRDRAAVLQAGPRRRG